MLVSVQELVTYMDISFSLRQQDAAELVLAGLQSELETYLRRPIEVTEFTEEYKIPADHLASPMSSFFYQRNPCLIGCFAGSDQCNDFIYMIQCFEVSC